MFPSFIGILDIQSWWEVPSIAYFCSLFRTAFNLLDFDIEELEEALLTDGTEECASSLLTELIVRLLRGCLSNNDISAFNYQMYLRRLFRRKCQETGRYNPFNTDIDFQFLPLRTKVEILYALCDFRLDADDVLDLFKNLEAESLRVEPLGWDDNGSAFWYFYGTRLYREDTIKKAKGKSKKKKSKEERKQGCCYGDEWLDEEDIERVWQVVCFTEADWTHLTNKFSKATSKVEKKLYRSLSQNFLPEIPRLFQEKERLQRKRRTRQDFTDLPDASNGSLLQNVIMAARLLSTTEFTLAQSVTIITAYTRTYSQTIVIIKDPKNSTFFTIKCLSAFSQSLSIIFFLNLRDHQPKVLSQHRLHKLLELPRRTSSRVLQKLKQKEEENKQSESEQKSPEGELIGKGKVDRENRVKRRNLIRSKRHSSSESDHSSGLKEMPPTEPKCNKNHDKISKNSTNTKGEPPPEHPVKAGRKTNNSLASATGEILISDDEPVNSTRKKLKTSQIFSQSAEDIKTDMYKVLEQLTAHEDAWPFLDPVEEEYAPNYYAVIRRPMDLKKMEERLDNAYYTDYSMFKADFKLIVNNCRLYNGQDNEYTAMVENLQNAFDRLTEKYIHRLSSSDEEIAVEYPLPTPSRKHKMKNSESPERVKKKKRKSHSETGMSKSSITESEKEQEDINNCENKESHKSKDEKSKKRRKGRHRHGKHSKSHKKSSHNKSDNGEGSKSSKRGKKSKRLKEGKKSKQKKKKNKEKKEETPEVAPLERSNSQESLESSNRSRSASPLPSIHTPTPSPEPELVPNPDFFKDKYDKIKERKRTTVKDAWETLINYKQKPIDKLKQNFHIPEKDKNQKLRETIEKLKAKNEKYKDSTIFNSLFSSSSQNSVLPPENNTEELSVKDNEATDSSDEDYDDPKINKDKQGKNAKKNCTKNHTTKNEIASEALEQAVKDISKWLDDAPKGSTLRSPCDSPTQTISTEEQDNSRQDDELYEKGLLSRKEMSRKRPSSREPRILKRREVQRTIDRLQPGKSKGNLLTNVSTTQKVEEQPPVGPLNKIRDITITGESSPKLSLGSVLPTVDFTLGNDHSFEKEEKDTETSTEKCKTTEIINTIVVEEPKIENVTEQIVEEPEVVPVIANAEPPIKTGQEKATPNLSAWFKAFGTPKSSAPGKKKSDENDQEEKPVESNSTDNKPSSPKTSTKYDSPGDEISPNPEGGDSPLPNHRHRRTSTGSSVSERSSFSQDLDSPRHQIAHSSPLLRSPASPRTDEFQKITYPIINGTIRAGFYQDTTSLKSSPEKSCSPRDAPQSPYSPYSQHVYASNSVGAINSTMQSPNYFMDHNKSPMPTYSQSQLSPYYEAAKPLIVNKPDITQQSQYTSRYSPNHTPYPQDRPAALLQNTNLSHSNVSNVTTAAPKVLSETKQQVFPVKKRAYNDLDTISSTKKIIENTTMKDDLTFSPNKEEYQKIVQSIHSLAALPTSSIDVNSINEKTEINKTNEPRDRSAIDLIDRHLQNLETHTSITYDSNDSLTKRKEVENVFSKPLGMSKKDNIDVLHSAYANIDTERRKHDEASSQNHHSQMEYNTINISKANSGTLPKGYEIDAIALNLGLNHAQSQKALNKNTVEPEFLDSEHTDKIPSEVINHNFSEFENLPLSGSSLNDINVDINKKLFSGNTNAPVPSDYDNWKTSSQMHRDSPPADLSTSYATENNKLRPETSCTNTNYKSYDHSQYQSYTMAHSNLSRNQELAHNMTSELRIPNPRGHLKNDTLTNNNVDSKSVDSNSKVQKPNKAAVDHAILSRYPYKGPFIPPNPLEPFLNIPGMFDRFTNDERFYNRFATTSLNQNKSFTMAQMLSKSGSQNAYQNSSCVSIFSHPSHGVATEKDLGYYKSPQVSQAELMSTKEFNKKKKSSATKQAQSANSQGYQPATNNPDVLSSSKSSVVPGSAFNFGTAQGAMSLGSLYADNGGFSIEDFRSSTANQLMAGNYMAAAAAGHQRTTKDSNLEKHAKPAHQNRAHTSSSFPFMEHPQVRPGYSFVGADPSSPLYQQYLQRHQEHLLRQTGAQIMSLYPTGYPSNLSVRQPYDSINRPSWL